MFRKLLLDKSINSFDCSIASNNGASSTKLSISNIAVTKLRMRAIGSFKPIYLYKLLVMKNKFLIMLLLGTLVKGLEMAYCVIIG